MHDGGVQDLVDSWAGLIARHTTDPEAADVGRRLIQAWSEPHRRYHCLAHLRDILARVEELAGDAENLDAVRLAAWYHDAVYDGLPDDEERSAVRAERDLDCLGVAPELVEEVGRLVRLTLTHDPVAGDRNGAVLSDADLAALALPRDRYRDNTAAILAEYSHVPTEVFRANRIQVLVALLEGPGVFRTARGRKHWEAAARENMRAELADLCVPFAD